MDGLEYVWFPFSLAIYPGFEAFGLVMGMNGSGGDVLHVLSVVFLPSLVSSYDVVLLHSGILIFFCVCRTEWRKLFSMGHVERSCWQGQFTGGRYYRATSVGEWKLTRNAVTLNAQ